MLTLKATWLFSLTIQQNMDWGDINLNRVEILIVSFLLKKKKLPWLPIVYRIKQAQPINSKALWDPTPTYLSSPLLSELISYILPTPDGNNTNLCVLSLLLCGHVLPLSETCLHL